MEVQEVPCRFIEWSEKWKCFTSDSFYIDGVVNGERWKFNHYGAVVRPQFKRYINLKMGGARFIKDSCRYQNCVILGCCDEGLLFDKIGDTLHFPQLTKDFFAAQKILFSSQQNFYNQWACCRIKKVRKNNPQELVKKQKLIIYKKT